MRRQRGLSLAAMEEKTGITKSSLSKVERGVTTPSIATVLKIAKAFGVEVAQLFGEKSDDQGICVVRRNERKPISRPGSRQGYRYDALAHTRRTKCMEPFIMRPPLKLDLNLLFEHEGEELVFVLSGRLEMVYADRRVTLGPGDSLYFDAHLLHGARSLGRKPAEILVVVGGA
jgi:transcriptional regulator with XRE-family HTH domain